MTRRDSEKDAERPYYYANFWLDIAAGRRVIGLPEPYDPEPYDDAISDNSEPALEPELPLLSVDSVQKEKSRCYPEFCVKVFGKQASEEARVEG